VAILDDNVGVDWDFCRELWEALAAEDIVWIGQCSLHITEHPDLMELARRSGCRLLSFGVESTDPASLSSVGKTWNEPQSYAEAFRALRDHGIGVSTEMIVGLDGDDGSVFDRTYDLVMDNAIALPRIYVLTPVPGTALYEELRAANRLLDVPFSQYGGSRVVFRPARLEPQELQAGYWRLYERLFSWRSIFHRVRRDRARLGAYLRAFVIGVNVHYRNHIRRRICPGIV
jgi:radical SAM superfamily enzyme YgiQ (UPF0313 family)